MREVLFLAHRIPYPPDRGDKIPWTPGPNVSGAPTGGWPSLNGTGTSKPVATTPTIYNARGVSPS